MSRPRSYSLAPTSNKRTAMSRPLQATASSSGVAYHPMMEERSNSRDLEREDEKGRPSTSSERVSLSTPRASVSGVHYTAPGPSSLGDCESQMGGAGEDDDEPMPMAPKKRNWRRRIIISLLILGILGGLFYSDYASTSTKKLKKTVLGKLKAPPPDIPTLMVPLDTDRSPRITKLTQVTLSEGADPESDELILRNLKLHAEHARAQGHGQVFEKADLMEGAWSRPALMLSQVFSELRKEKKDRAEWLFWHDWDTVIINPELSLDVFLPPPDIQGLNLLYTADMSGLDDAVYFLRIGHWAVEFLSMVLSHRIGTAADDRQAYEKVINEVPHVKDRARRLPAAWLNHPPPYISPGDLLVRCSPTPEWRANLTDFVAIAESHDPRWELPLRKTMLGSATRKFWDGHWDGDMH